MKKFYKIVLFVCLLLSVVCLPQTISAESFFNPNYIISDSELLDYKSMSQVDIQNFLESKPGTLANKYFLDYQGNYHRASEIIYNAAQEHQINPKFILAMLQKEQGLIDDSNPTQGSYDWATSYGLCDNCNANDPGLAIFKGFGKQVDFLVRINRKYYENPHLYNFQIGQTDEVDLYLVTPANQATANLYNYTPHYEGNYNFWQIWQDFWQKIYPDGSLLQAVNERDVWYIQMGLRRQISSYSVLLSRFDPNKIITVTQEDLEKYDIGKPIKFTNYSLLRNPQGTVYLLVDDKLRRIVSPEVFRTIGFNWEEVINVLDEDLAGMEIVEPITLESVYPTGALLQNKQTGGIYYVENGIKKPIWSKELWQANYKNKVLTQVSPDELDKYPTEEPVKFKDGELIKSHNKPDVYVISEGKRRPIISGEVFEKLGYMWDNIIVTSQKVVDIHALGELVQ